MGMRQKSGDYTRQQNYGYLLRFLIQQLILKRFYTQNSGMCPVFVHHVKFWLCQNVRKSAKASKNYNFIPPKNYHSFWELDIMHKNELRPRIEQNQLSIKKTRRSTIFFVAYCFLLHFY